MGKKKKKKDVKPKWGEPGNQPINPLRGGNLNDGLTTRGGNIPIINSYK